MQFYLFIYHSLIIIIIDLSFRANHLLAALAFADMAVFIFMLPTGLSALPQFYESTTFRIIFAHTKTHFAALANWFSCSAIWFVN